MDAVKDLERCFAIAAGSHAVRDERRALARQAQGYEDALHGLALAHPDFGYCPMTAERPRARARDPNGAGRGGRRETALRRSRGVMYGVQLNTTPPGAVVCQPRGGRERDGQ